MKRTITVLGLLLLFVAAKAQIATTKVELTCYNKWAQKFEERGAEEVLDGTYTDVIITFRQGAKADCFNGKAIVKEGKVLSFYLELEDGSYDQFMRIAPADAKNMTIFNGMTRTVTSIDKQLVNIIWPAKLKPKKAMPKKAPEPDDD